jgi:hypothetical protein
MPLLLLLPKSPHQSCRCHVGVLQRRNVRPRVAVLCRDVRRRRGHGFQFACRRWSAGSACSALLLRSESRSC